MLKKLTLQIKSHINNPSKYELPNKILSISPISDGLEIKTTIEKDTRLLVKTLFNEILDTNHIKIEQITNNQVKVFNYSKKDFIY